MGRAIGKNELSQIDKAEKYIFKGIQIAQKLDAKPPLAFGYLCLGELYTDNGQKDKAMGNLNKAYLMYKEMGVQYWPDKIREVMDRL